MDELSDDPVNLGAGDDEVSPARPFYPKPTLALDHPPPINVEMGTGAHGQPARPARVMRPLEAGGLRIVIIAWCVWLLGSWGLAVLADNGVPMVRWMLLSSLMGMMLVWPAARLGQEVHPHEPGRGSLQAFLDWLAMIVVFQAVIWSLRFHAGWSVERTLWLDASFAGWTLVAACIVGWARAVPNGLIRMVGMALCIGITLAQPMRALLMPRLPETDAGYLLNPAKLVYDLTLRQNQSPLELLMPQVIVVVGAGIAGWVVIALWSRLDRRLDRRAPNAELEVIDIAAGHREGIASDTITADPAPVPGDH